MSKSNANFVNLLKEICAEEEIRLESFSDEWAHRLSKNGRDAFILGFQFPLNRASSKEVCQDKAITYEALAAAGISAVEHYFYPSFATREGNGIYRPVSFALDLLRRDGKIVLKDNQGTGGNRVYLAENEQEFNDTLEMIHSYTYGACVSPFYEIREEYRVIMLAGRPQLIIRKDRQYETDENGEKHYLTWKHNLGQGATGVVQTSGKLKKALGPIAKEVVRALDMEFCSVDIIDTKDGLKVLEVNGGVMMEHFSGQNEECRAIAKGIYRKAIKKALRIR